MKELIFIECTKCKSLKLLKNFLNDQGKKLKTCIICRYEDARYRNKNKCIHNKKKSICKECWGVSICVHGKIKYRCKICGGSSICEHNKIKSQCKTCDGSSICEHGKRKSTCRQYVIVKINKHLI